VHSYTKSTKEWLDIRFRQTTNEGIYLAHQPIYGFKGKNCEPFIINRYTITYHVMNELNKIEFNSLLDVGGAEGYKAALVKKIFDCKVRSCDLSQEAVNRAKEIFNIDGESIDIHSLPYDDNEFDVVLCSETLEHVQDIRKATLELVRVCRKAVMITVPHEAPEIVEKNKTDNIPHAHIHALDINSFDFIKPYIKEITYKKILHPLLNIPAAIIEANKKETNKSNYSNLSVNLYNKSIPLLKLFSNIITASFLMKIDHYLANKNFPYSGLLFILYKQDDIIKDRYYKTVNPKSILNFKVPYYYLIKK
jgi:ubiquinone/menaquinone biosynthesis C-methylase UbiE